MAVDETHGVGQAIDVLIVFNRLGYDVIGLQETRRIGHTAFIEDDYLLYCSWERGGETNGKKGLDGVGLATKNSITRSARPPEFTSYHLLKVTLQRRGRAKVVTLTVAYAPTKIQRASCKHAFWSTLDRAVGDVSIHEQLFMVMAANARTERGEKGGLRSKDN